ncbi:MAG: aminotransferase class III-fold pyridoxal phosphate-dependent enzyme, partial [Ilumatobacteraceae bacterium]
GNGMPIGAVWAKKSVAGVFQPGDHGSTFSGTAIATAAARATIQVMKEINAPELARAKGKYLSESLQKIPGIIDVRGRGLLLGAELKPGTDAKLVYNSLLDHGLVTNAVTATALRLAPPITVSTEEIDQAVAIIADVLQ